MEDAFSKVCEVFGIEKLQSSIKLVYVVQKEKDIFVNLPTGFA